MKKNIILIFIIITLILLLIGISFLHHNKIPEISFTNKILQYGYGTIGENQVYSDVMVFNEDNTFYYFISELDGRSELKARIGTWSEIEDGVRVEFTSEIYLKNGILVDDLTDEYASDQKLIGGNLNKVDYNGGWTILLDKKLHKEVDDIHKHFIINNLSYYILDEFENNDELLNDLEIMYGNEMVEVLKNTIENQEESR